jgi:hypothetical protein
MKDFYFIFYPVGPQFIKTMMINFAKIPQDCNVVVMTPTPELLKDVKVDFNLIVLDSEDLIDDFTRKTDSVIKETDHDLYIQKLEHNLNNNVRFCDITNRWIMPWLVKNNITKFAIINCDCLINFDGELRNVYDHIAKTYENRNVLFGPVMHHHYDKQRYYDVYGEVFENNGVSKEYVKELEVPIRVFDGWMRGFWFQDVRLVELYFKLWDGLIKLCYEIDSHDLKMSRWIVTDEWATAFIGEMMAKSEGVEIEDIMYDSKRLVRHIYHPENDYFSLHHGSLYVDGYGMKTAKNRKEFFEINKNQIIHFYANQNGIPQERIKEVIFDYE